MTRRAASRRSSPRGESMKLKPLVFGLLGGAIGAAIWAGIVIGSHRESGWIAWGIGGLVGLAVRLGSLPEEGSGPGVLAVLIAVVAIVAGKYMAVHFLVEQEVAKVPLPSISDNDMIVAIADDVVEEFEGQKKRLKWPPGFSVENAEKPEHYP